MSGLASRLIRGGARAGTVARVSPQLLTGRLPRPDGPGPDAPRLPPAPAEARVRVTFVGASTVLVQARGTTLMVDPFFSRPSALRCLVGTIAPDPGVVDSCLQRLGVERLDAVVVSHSHYDHVLDAAYVARRTGARLVGSRSTAMVGRGAKMPPDDIEVVEGRTALRVGQATVTLVPSAHASPVHLTGDIESPVEPPTHVWSYRVGPCLSVHVQQTAENALLVQGSAGLVPGALADLSADAVYLAVGSLGRAPQSSRERYWQEVVRAVGARRVLPTHWDDMWRPATLPLVPLPYLVDDLSATVPVLQKQAKADGVDLRWPTQWQPTDPFGGLDD